MGKYRQGKFKPKNPQKYKGDPTNIVYRSSWEFTYLSRLDNDPNVLKYSSEEIVIPYRSPIDGKIHRYFPDNWVKKKDPTTGKIIEFLVEIKPNKERNAPTPKTKPQQTKRYLNEVKTWGVNSSKWEAAKAFCRTRGWSFIILDEYDLGIAKRTPKPKKTWKPFKPIKRK